MRSCLAIVSHLKVQLCQTTTDVGTSRRSGQELIIDLGGQILTVDILDTLQEDICILQLRVLIVGVDLKVLLIEPLGILELAVFFCLSSAVKH